VKMIVAKLDILERLTTMIRLRLSTFSLRKAKAKTKPVVKSEWDISSLESRGDPQLGRAFLSRWGRR
jgi:hypothetical protein